MNPFLARVGLFSFIACLMAITCQAQYHYNHMTGTHEIRNVKPRNYMGDYSQAKAAGKNLTGFLRGEVAFSMLFSNFTYEHSFLRTHHMTGEVSQDTSFSMALKPKVSFGITSSTSKPICDMGKNAALLWYHGIFMNYFKFQTDSLHLGGRFQTHQIVAMQMGVPMTIDYKIGSEAMLDQSKNTTFGIGVGLIPTLNLSDVNITESSMSFGVYPYAKVEFGVFWKICMKLRASCQLGKHNFLQLDKYSNQPYETNAINLTGGPIFALSFVVMPLSFDWNKDGW